MLNHLSNPENRYRAALDPEQADEIENYFFLEECESKARALGDLEWADLLLSQLQRIERDFTSDQREVLRIYP
ncbi:MAG: hypothetical protein KC800_08975 [Candidatus Eremiobacteraeota bacterium]|nr:hypothetical protein [Candidatus Eremiobacteraeota bacterium]